ncbi:MAG TPA: hypothetical protein VFQ76_05740 [Longimicrobiaceae bacterium]|nr:hypothetical protein [Longimicrobiaceae bacterium]
MSYETPQLLAPAEMYEAPMLIDLEDLPASGSICCTGGSAVE